MDDPKCVCFGVPQEDTNVGERKSRRLGVAVGEEFFEGLKGLSICNHALHHALVTTITMLIDTVCCGQLRSDDTRDLFNKYLSTLPDDIRSRYDELQTISARGTPH
jgi:hypothetical protein